MLANKLLEFYEDPDDDNAIYYAISISRESFPVKSTYMDYKNAVKILLPLALKAGFNITDKDIQNMGYEDLTILIPERHATEAHILASAKKLSTIIPRPSKEYLDSWESDIIVGYGPLSSGDFTKSWNILNGKVS